MHGHLKMLAAFRAEVTNMRPAKEFRAASEAFRRDQQSWTFLDPLLIFAIRHQKLVARLNYAHITQESYKRSTNLLSNF